MNDRRRYITNRPRENRPTARSRIVSVLSEEILASAANESFLLGSEYQLCRRFKVSRVTIRLALDDLENCGLVFRKHGVGTFAHGKTSRVQRHLAVLVDDAAFGDNSPLANFVAGVHAFAKEQGTFVLYTDQPPECWRPELASILSGVIVMFEEVSLETTTNLRHRRLPYLIIGKSEVSSNIEGHLPAIDGARALARSTEESFQAGHLAAKLVMNAFFRIGPAPSLPQR